MAKLTLAQAREILQLSLAEYSAERADYWAIVYDVVNGYLLSSSSSATYKNRLKRAMLESFTRVGDIAWVDGRNELPLDQEANQWLTNKMNAEIGYIDSLFSRLQLLRKQESKETIQDTARNEATRTAEGYAGTLDTIYSTIKLLAGKDKMLTFTGVDGKSEGFPCRQCRSYKGKRHRASWWVSHDAIPGSHTGFDCKGYNCQHVLVDDGGQIWTL